MLVVGDEELVRRTEAHLVTFADRDAGDYEGGGGGGYLDGKVKHLVVRLPLERLAHAGLPPGRRLVACPVQRREGTEQRLSLLGRRLRRDLDGHGLSQPKGARRNGR